MSFFRMLEPENTANNAAQAVLQKPFNSDDHSGSHTGSASRIQNSGITPKLIANLCGAMARADQKPGTMPAGITYLGQMIAHDIVPATSGAETFLGTNEVKGELNLDSLYGDEEFRHQYMEKGKFKLGYAVKIGSDGSTTEVVDADLLRIRRDNKVCIPESRNDENVLVSQLHLFWLRLHNKVVDELAKGTDDNTIDHSVAAREIVTKLFHRVTIDDFLFHVLDPQIYELYCIHKKRYFGRQLNESDEQGGTACLVPAEFSRAAFRFGHSLVRDFYRLKENGKKIELSQLFISNHGEPMPFEKTVEWQQLFGLNAEMIPFQTAARIDLRFASSMSKAPSPTGHSAHIIGANLEAALEAGLWTGGEAIDLICEHNMELAEYSKIRPEDGYQHPSLRGTLLGQAGFEDTSENLPLWLYILTEDNSLHERGMTLGKLGSIFVAEVLMNAMETEVNQQDIPELTLYDRLVRPSMRLKMIDLIDFVDGVN